MRVGTFLRTLAVLVALPFAASEAQERVLVSGENARMLPRAAFDAPGTPVAKGSTLTVLQRQNDWVLVYDGKTQGYMHSAFLTSMGSAPVQPAPQPMPQAQPQMQPQMQPQYPQYPQQQGAPAYGAPAGYAAQPGQIRFPNTPGYKDPTTAMLFSAVVIGGGQFYAGEKGKGFLLATLGYGSWMLVYAVAANEVDDCYDDIYSGDYYSDCGASNIGAAAWAAYGLTFGSWLYGIFTADDAAKRTNMKPVYAVSPVFKADNKRVSLGMSYTWGR